MRKLALVGSSIVYLLSAVMVFAQSPTPQIKISPPTQGYSDLGAFVTNVLTLSFIVAVLVVLVMLIWGAFEWITSGGDKEAVGKARNRIINALIGLAVLAVAFALFKVAGQFLGFPTTEFTIPTPP
ncbi:hypothetical protein HYT18_01275 [Candidatus Microgenomates bacterium]|nr:hypothetical protein [Candidatus Microgenomates bacterium]